MDWKDTLIPGASRIPKPYDGVLDPGWVNDFYGTPIERNDWVYGPGGKPMISGSGPESEWNYQPSPGFFPVDAGNYKTGANTTSAYAGREADPEYRGYYSNLQKGGYFNSKKDLRNDPSSLLQALGSMAGGTDYMLLLKQLGYDPGA